MRRLLSSVFAAALFCVGSTVGLAQDFPNDTIKIIVPASAGSAPDIVARLLSERLAQSLDNPVIVENKAGGNGIVAVNTFKRAKPDGHTIALFHAAAAITTPIMYEEADFDVGTETEIVSSIAYTPMVFVTGTDSGISSMAELVAAAQAEPDELVIGAPSHGSIPHLTAALLGQNTEADFRFVNYLSTGQAVQSVVTGDIPAYVNGAAPLLPLIEAGRVVPLSYTSDEVLPEFKDIPLTKDVFEDEDLIAKGWFIMLAPKGTPEEVLERYHTEITALLADADIQEKLKGLGNYPIIESREDTRAFLDREKELWARVIKQADIKPM